MRMTCLPICRPHAVLAGAVALTLAIAQPGTRAQTLTQTSARSSASTTAPAAWAGDLTPIAATDWNVARAAHLLERAGFGATPEEIARFAAMSPSESRG